MNTYCSTLICISALSFLAPLSRADLTIVSEGKSAFTIVIPASAPKSLLKAAEELQRDIEIASDAKIPISRDDTDIKRPLISLGSTKHAHSAGIHSDPMATESYRILTKDGNLYILGPDTPDGAWTPRNGVSDGTANGVYSFLEDYLDVRWLMPGEIGRDVPRSSSIHLSDIDQSFTPKFNYREVSHLNDQSLSFQFDRVMEWKARMRLGGSTDWDFNHNWWRTLNRSSHKPSKVGVYPWIGSSDPNTDTVREIYTKYPEWFAMDENGKRPFPKNQFSKLETTNPDLVKWFAEQAIETLKASDRPIAYSLSPSDGSNWSESPESKALYDANPDTTPDLEDPTASASMSSVVAKWYHDIAEIVAREYPEGHLTGFIYASYINPPEKVRAQLPKNFTAQIATSRAYGYGLFRPETQKYFKRVTDDWAKIISGDWYYYDLPTQLMIQSWAAIGREGNANFSGSTGLVTPAAPEIVDFIFPQLLRSHITGAKIYGVPSFSNAALSNYILAKMEWDPSQSAANLQKEWLHRAYGSAAGAVMERFHVHLNDCFRAYYQKNESARYNLTIEALKDLFAANYPELEKIYLEATAQSMNDIQRQRLQLIGDNLIVLQWRLRNLSFLPKDISSSLKRSDAQISNLIEAGNVREDFQMFPGLTRRVGGSDKLPWKVRYTDQPLPENSLQPQWAEDAFLLYAAQDGEIQISTLSVDHGPFFAGYEIRSSNGRLITSGIFSREKPIAFPVKSGESFSLNIPLRKSTNFHLRVRDAAIPRVRLDGETLYLSGRPAPVYLFHIPGAISVGAKDEVGGVSIQKPFGNRIAEEYRDRRFSEIRQFIILNDAWRFQIDPQNNGIERGVLKADFDDSLWTPISTENWWQLQGFPDYHGTAWYRVKFQSVIPKEGEMAHLLFGAVDGNAEIYLNGQKVGEHILVPDSSGWNSPFIARVPQKLVPGENILAVKVTSKNEKTASGIFRGVSLIIGTPKSK